MRILKLLLKRLVVLALEVFVEAFLLGAYLGALTVDDFLSKILGVWTLALAVAVLLYIQWYYFTRAFFGLVWRSRTPWLYPAIAAAAFVLHAHLVAVGLRESLTPFGRALEPPFLAGGACLVFACAFGGGWLLRKWTPAVDGDGPGRQHRVVVAGRT